MVGDLFSERGTRGLAVPRHSAGGVSVINTFQGGEGTFTSTRVDVGPIRRACRNATVTGPMSGPGKNQSPSAVCEEHPQARPLSSESSFSRVPKERKHEGRGSMVRRGRLSSKWTTRQTASQCDQDSDERGEAPPGQKTEGRGGMCDQKPRTSIEALQAKKR